MMDNIEEDIKIDDADLQDFNVQGRDKCGGLTFLLERGAWRMRGAAIHRGPQANRLPRASRQYDNPSNDERYCTRGTTCAVGET